MPGKVSKPGSIVVFDDAGHGDGDGLYAGEDEVHFNLLNKSLIKLSLINIGGEFDGMQEFAAIAEEGDKGFSTSNIYT